MIETIWWIMVALGCWTLAGTAVALIILAPFRPRLGTLGLVAWVPVWGAWALASAAYAIWAVTEVVP